MNEVPRTSSYRVDGCSRVGEAAGDEVSPACLRAQRDDEVPEEIVEHAAVDEQEDGATAVLAVVPQDVGYIEQVDVLGLLNTRSSPVRHGDIVQEGKS
jgi:hypothetical protein